MKNRVMTVAVTVCLAATSVLTRADIKTAARKIQAENKDAVIWVEAVLKMQISNQGQTRNQDQEVRSLGTVLNADGLTVVPNTALNPSGMMAQMMQSMGVDMSGNLTDVKLLMADGTEIDADVILKDEDLDLAFLAPSENEDDKDLPAFGYVDLDNSTQPEIMDELVVLGRLPKFMNRQESISIVRLASIIEKPRTFYFCSDLDGMGVPAFGKDGGLVGISVLRKGSKMTLQDLQGGGGFQAVILPSEDVLEISKQAIDEIARRDADK